MEMMRIREQIKDFWTKTFILIIIDKCGRHEGVAESWKDALVNLKPMEYDADEMQKIKSFS
jgi:hypothetical protein